MRFKGAKTYTMQPPCLSPVSQSANSHAYTKSKNHTKCNIISLLCLKLSSFTCCQLLYHVVMYTTFVILTVSHSLLFAACLFLSPPFRPATSLFATTSSLRFQPTDYPPNPPTFSLSSTYSLRYFCAFIPTKLVQPFLSPVITTLLGIISSFFSLIESFRWLHTYPSTCRHQSSPQHPPPPANCPARRQSLPTPTWLLAPIVAVMASLQVNSWLLVRITKFSALQTAAGPIFCEKPTNRKLSSALLHAQTLNDNALPAHLTLQFTIRAAPVALIPSVLALLVNQRLLLAVPRDNHASKPLLSPLNTPTVPMQCLSTTWCSMPTKSSHSCLHVACSSRRPPLHLLTTETLSLLLASTLVYYLCNPTYFPALNVIFERPFQCHNACPLCVFPFAVKYAICSSSHLTSRLSTSCRPLFFFLIVLYVFFCCPVFQLSGRID